MRILVAGHGDLVEQAILRALREHGHVVVTRGPVAPGVDAIVCAMEDGSLERMLDAATEHGIRRYVHLSRLGAQDTANHAENLVRGWQGQWTICRIGPVYGPGEPAIAALLKAIRTMPVIPVVEDFEFQPLWADDLGEAVARVVEREDLGHRTLELAGPDPMPLGHVVRRLAELTGSRPRFVPVPSWLTEGGVKAVRALGLGDAIERTPLSALLHQAAIPKGRANALVGELGVQAVSLGEGIRRLVEDVPAATPADGAGPLWRGRYYADLAGCGCVPDELFTTIRDEFASLMPPHVWSGFEPGRIGLAEGDVVSVPLPLRGTAQLRCEEIRPLRITFVTLEDQPFSGALRLLVEQRGDRVRFEVQTYERAANVTELLALAAGGTAFKQRAWNDLVERVVIRSGGAASAGIVVEQEALPDDQAALVEDWVEDLLAGRHRTPAKHRSRSRTPTPKRDFGSRSRVV